MTLTLPGRGGGSREDRVATADANVVNIENLSQRYTLFGDYKIKSRRGGRNGVKRTRLRASDRAEDVESRCKNIIVT